jgi:rod shape-determining protein MreD
LVKKNNIFGILIIFSTIILQSTILNNFTLKGVKPDYVLIMIILFANFSGSIKGQLIGFSSGLIEDFLSLSPLGFNSLMNAVIGYLGGTTSGKIFLDPIVVPIVFVFIGTLLKSFLSFILLSLFLTEKSASIYTSAFLIELGLNLVITPFIYLFFKLLRILPTSNDSRIS